ncbi:MAG: DMT family transporter [candidate division Zixibacteria bacterium]|nr:DMT family transporter [candidate division Zixibacteria bacterium]
MIPFGGELAALTTAICWSFTAIFFSEAGRRIGSFRVNAMRLILAVAIYTIILLVTTGRLFPEDLNSRQVLWLALSGLIGLVIGDGCGFKALVMIGPRLTTLLWGTAPIMATAIAWVFLGETLQITQILGIAVTVGGVSWVIAERRFTGNNQFNLAIGHPDAGSLLRGVLLGLLAALGQATGLVLSKHAMLDCGGTMDALPASFLRMLSSMIMIWLFAALRGKFVDTIRGFRDSKALLYAGGGAFFGPFLGVWTSLIAVKYIAAGIAATLNATTPVWIIPNVVLYYKERVTSRAILGAIVAVLGVALLIIGDEILRSI